MYNQILDRLMCPAVVWEWDADKDIFICVYTNNKIPEISKNDHFSHILDVLSSKESINFIDQYTKSMYEFKKSDSIQESNIKKDDLLIALNKIKSGVVLEIHYPNNNDVHLLSVVNHKIRSPLTNIIGVITLLYESDFDETTTNYFNLIRESSFEIVNTVNDLVDILNFKKGVVKLDNVETSLKNVLLAVYDVIKTKAGQKQTTIKLNIEKQLPPIVVVDKDRLCQILIHLIENSLAYVKNGNITIDAVLYNQNLETCPFAYHKCSPPEYNILFKVKDNGPGISLDKQEMIRSVLGMDNNPTEIYKGFGMKLCKLICNLMGGNIWFKSDSDMGTIMYFNIVCQGINLGN